MPGNVNLANGVDVLPAALCKEFVRAESFNALRNTYPDGRVQWMPMHGGLASDVDITGRTVDHVELQVQHSFTAATSPAGPSADISAANIYPGPTDGRYAGGSPVSIGIQEYPSGFYPLRTSTISWIPDLTDYDNSVADPTGQDWWTKLQGVQVHAAIGGTLFWGTEGYLSGHPAPGAWDNAVLSFTIQLLAVVMTDGTAIWGTPGAGSTYITGTRDFVDYVDPGGVGKIESYHTSGLSDPSGIQWTDQMATLRGSRWDIPFGVEPRRKWKLKRRLTPLLLAELREFLLAHPTQEFLFYDPFDVDEGNPIGSNWDATGESLEGRFTVRLEGEISQEMGLGRGDIPLQLVELAQGFGDGEADFSGDGNPVVGAL